MKAMIDPKIWTDADFEDIEDFATIAFYVYLMANNACNTIGIYRLSMRQAMSDTRLTKQEINQCIDRLNEVENTKVRYDTESKWLWVIGLFKHNVKAVKNKSIAKSVIRMIDTATEEGCPFMDEFNSKYSTSVSLVNDQCDTVIGIGTGKGIGKDTIDKVLAEMGVKSHQLADAIIKFQQARVSNKKPALTEHALNLQIKQMQKAKLTPSEMVECIEMSIANGWQGIFPQKKKEEEQSRWHS